MSIFIPYTVSSVIDYFSTTFSLDLTTLTNYEMLTLTLYANLYFFVFWFFIIYFALKIFNRIWERFF